MASHREGPCSILNSQRGIFGGLSAISPSSSAFRRLRHSTNAEHLRLQAAVSH
jgi:hypothetical protein